MTNYYEVLGIEQGSTPQEIKKSFRRRAKEIHPDVRRDGGIRSEEDMRLLLAAYAVLGSMTARSGPRLWDSTIGSTCESAPTIPSASQS
jgi:curved DNA-binding protein CbpA